MKIGIDARLMHHQPAGISKYTHNLVHALAQIDPRNEYVIFQHRRHREPVIEHAGFQRQTLYAPVQSRLEQAMLPLELVPQGLDLMHSTDFIPPLYARLPRVITVHDLAFLHWPHFLTERSAAYYGQIDRAALRARHIIVPSESTKQDLCAQLGVRESKVSVIYEAVDDRLQPLPLEETRRVVTQKFRLPETYILCVGTVEPRKNVDGLLHAFRYLIDKYHLDDVDLAIAGSFGWLYEETLATMQELRLDGRAHFLGRISDDDLWQLYVGARCHVHVAHYEGFGLTPLEAMACGTPTVVSNISSLPEVVSDAALLVDPQNHEEIAVALHRLLTDDRLHTELRQKGLERARHFSWEKAARDTLAVYERAVG